MINRIMDISLYHYDKYSIFVNNMFLFESKKENHCWMYFIKFYFELRLRKVDFVKKYLRLDYFDSDYNYSKIWKEGLQLYIPSDIYYQEIKDIFKAIRGKFKYCYATRTVTVYELYLRVK